MTELYDTTKIEVNGIVQVKPDAGTRFFDSCFIVVTELKSFGIQGYVQVPEVNGGQAYVRLKWDQFAPVGAKAIWVQP